MTSIASEPEMRQATLGVILAGGQALRMGGGDKTLRPLAGRPLLDHVATALKPQVAALALNANGDPARFRGWTLPVIGDAPPSGGPLSGILAALDWAASRPGAGWVVTVPGDTPFIPHDLVERLHQARRRDGLPLACASSGGRLHPPVGLWPVNARDALRAALAAGEGRVARWAMAQGLAIADWPDAPLDPFFNANTPADLARAEALLAG